MVLPLTLTLLLATCAPDSTHPSTRPATTVAEVQRREGNPVTHWSAIAGRLMVDPGPLMDTRAFAILYASIHDAVNGIERRFQPYVADLRFPNASVEAAVATAARDVLVTLSPSTRSAIQAEYDSAMAAIPAGVARAEGVKLGRRSARLNLAAREGDGVPIGPWPPSEGPITQPRYTPSGRPGDYDFTPPFDAPPLGPVALFPGWGRLPPFASEPGPHGIDGPDPLRSREYAGDVNHVKEIGRLDSRTRTAEQTEIARFWFEEIPIWNHIATDVVQRNRLGTWRAARVLALVHFAMADAGFACWEAKYRYRFWRPYTAIRRAREDGNGGTRADPQWLPLLWTSPEVIPPRFLIPPIPEYPSAAATISSAAAEVLAHHLGDRVAFEAVSSILPEVTRRFASFTAAAKESGLSRVYGGIHFRDAVEDGHELGKSIGSEVGRALAQVR